MDERVLGHSGGGPYLGVQIWGQLGSRANMEWSTRDAGDILCALTYTW
jgi:hypothetical protein